MNVLDLEKERGDLQFRLDKLTLFLDKQQRHHRAGNHWSQRRKTRYKSLTHAVYAESVYEWHKREKQNPELAQELNDLFDLIG